MLKRRITNGIRCAPCSGARGSKNTSRANALCGVFSHPHSSPPQTLGLLYKVGWNVVYLERYVKVLQLYWKNKTLSDLSYVQQSYLFCLENNRLYWI